MGELPKPVARISSLDDMGLRNMQQARSGDFIQMDHPVVAGLVKTFDYKTAGLLRLDGEVQSLSLWQGIKKSPRETEGYDPLLVRVAENGISPLDLHKEMQLQSMRHLFDAIGESRALELYGNNPPDKIDVRRLFQRLTDGRQASLSLGYYREAGKMEANVKPEMFFDDMNVATISVAESDPTYSTLKHLQESLKMSTTRLREMLKAKQVDGATIIEELRERAFLKTAFAGLELGFVTKKTQ